MKKIGSRDNHSKREREREREIDVKNIKHEKRIFEKKKIEKITQIKELKEYYFVFLKGEGQIKKEKKRFWQKKLRIKLRNNKNMLKEKGEREGKI